MNVLSVHRVNTFFSVFFTLFSVHARLRRTRFQSRVLAFDRCLPRTVRKRVQHGSTIRSGLTPFFSSNLPDRFRAMWISPRYSKTDFLFGGGKKVRENESTRRFCGRVFSFFRKLEEIFVSSVCYTDSEAFTDDLGKRRGTTWSEVAEWFRERFLRGSETATTCGFAFSSTTVPLRIERIGRRSLNFSFSHSRLLDDDTDLSPNGSSARLSSFYSTDRLIGQKIPGEIDFYANKFALTIQGRELIVFCFFGV